jgi:hypothetical protein
VVAVAAARTTVANGRCAVVAARPVLHLPTVRAGSSRLEDLVLVRCGRQAVDGKAENVPKPTLPDRSGAISLCASERALAWSIEGDDARGQPARPPSRGAATAAHSWGSPCA